MNSTIILNCKIEIIQIFIIPVISLFGIIFNGLCIVTFSHMILKNPKLAFKFCFKCHLCKSICNFLTFIIQIFGPIYFCKKCNLSNSLISNIWFVYLFNFAETPLITCSTFYDIIALIDFFFIISNRKNLLYKIKTRYLFLIVLLIFSLLGSIIFFRYEIISQSSNNSSVFRNQRTNFYISELDKYVRFVEMIMYNILTFLLIIIVDILIIYQIKQAIKRKRNLNHNNNDNKSKIPNSQSIIENATRKTLYILIITSGLYLIGHFLIIVYYLPFDKNSQPTFWLCFYDIALIPFYSSFLFDIFIYYCFNKHFKKSFNTIFIKLFLNKNK